MKRVIVVGSSHVAALKSALDAAPDAFPDLEFSFFATRMAYFSQLSVDASGVLSTDGAKRGRADAAESVEQSLERLNGTTRCDLTGADAIVWCGFTAGTKDNETPHYSVLRLLHGYDVPGLRETGNPRVMGRATFDAILRSQARHQVLPPDWMRGGLPPIFALLPPAPAETLSEAPGGVFGALRKLQREPQGCSAAIAFFLDMIEEALSQQGVPLIRQPGETINDMGLTLQRYNESPVNIARKSKTFDARHMNTEYGRLCLRDIAARVGQSS